MPSVASAQALQPPTTGGAVALAQELRFLGHNKRVLMIGAHPDDEYTELLALLARGMGVEAAYLSLNRGEGGQNLIGNELGEELGVLRTGELLASRQVDGARQYFTRAYDFGFSKNLEDTWAHWPKDSVLKDVVRIIRQFQPQIIVSVFSGTPSDGHGQHQAAGWAAIEAFRIAGDSTAFPGTGRAWTPLKLYRSARFDTTGTSLVLEGGGIDQAVGQSYRQIAAKGRSFHRSQDMGQLQEPGNSRIPLRLLEDRTGTSENALFAGIDTSITGIWRGQKYGASRQVTLYERLMVHPEQLTAEVAMTAYQQLFETNLAMNQPVIADQMKHLAKVYLTLRGIQVDAYTRKPRIVRGEVDTAFIVVWNTSEKPFEAMALVPAWGIGPYGTAHKDYKPAQHLVEPGKVVTIAIPFWGQHPLRTQPYYLGGLRGADMYPGMQQLEFGEPFQQPFLTSSVVITEGRETVGFERQVVYRTNDQALGEVREPVQFVTVVDTKLEPRTALWKSGDSTAYTFTVTLTHNTTKVSEGVVELEVPKGWRTVPVQPFRMTRVGERQVFIFQMRPGRVTNGDYEIKAFARMQDSLGKPAREGLGVVTIDYPHVVAQQRVIPAVSHVRVAPLIVQKIRRVGYVRGAADRVPEALMQVGVPITMLTGFDIETKDLSSYRAIIIGPRAFETDPELPAANDQLLAYAKNGGLVITQYQQYGYFLFNYAPYSMTVGGRTPGTTTVNALSRDSTRGTAPTTAIPTALLGGHDRVTDENAPVSVVDAASPVLRSPNRITADDWNGWVQERGLYFARTWDKEWKPVISMHDPDESPLEGSLLVSRVGKGTYVYTGLSFFRQLPAGVPGAFRLFANLLALASR